jgi:hypothetical protein
MCKQCVVALNEVFPEVPKEEWCNFLMDCTCYPFGQPEDVKKQLVALRGKMTTDDYHECYDIADKEIDEAMRNKTGELQ